MQLGYGYEDANTLRKDPAFEVAVNRSGVQETLASQLTLTRLENGVNLVDLSRMREVFLEFYTDCISLFKPIAACWPGVNSFATRPRIPVCGAIRVSTRADANENGLECDTAAVIQQSFDLTTVSASLMERHSSVARPRN